MTYVYTATVKGKAKRLYSSKDLIEAYKFARMFSGYVFEYLPNRWRVLI